MAAVFFAVGGAIAGGGPSAPASAAVAQKAAPAPTQTRAPRPATRPSWRELLPAQQAALRPLAARWPSLSEAQKRKWIAIADNFDALTPEEQAKLHSRMAEWVALSPQQRAQARLNFGEAGQLTAAEKKARWEAYQALPDDEKRRLAIDSRPRTPTTAAPVRPVSPDKLATVPRSSHDEAKPPRIAAPEPSTPPPAAPDQ
ncbi:DUF3106 domain-containing protein [Ramlibacter sp. AN1015]|uniref:DUF3106 domain-containing protein n=1 Tax=Ramlibacter sp. AN1015 TaxID=3133428 RepID=UPI0030C49F61